MYFDEQNEQLARNLHANETGNLRDDDYIHHGFEDTDLNTQGRIRSTENGVNEQLLRNESKLNLFRYFFFRFLFILFCLYFFLSNNIKLNINH